jgi:hypothetical protein
VSLVVLELKLRKKRVLELRADKIIIFSLSLHPIQSKKPEPFEAVLNGSKSIFGRASIGPVSLTVFTVYVLFTVALFLSPLSLLPRVCKRRREDMRLKSWS